MSSGGRILASNGRPGVFLDYVFDGRHSTSPEIAANFPRIEASRPGNFIILRTVLPAELASRIWREDGEEKSAGEAGRDLRHIIQSLVNTNSSPEFWEAIRIPWEMGIPMKMGVVRELPYDQKRLEEVLQPV
jgi:hypothetical protein